MSMWTAADIPDQTGRVIIVTGANSGLGLATTRALASKGAYVVMACRNVEAGRQARASVPGGDNHSEVRALDLADLDSVHAFADDIADWRIDVVINNAGVMNTPLLRTAAGHELQFGTNVLGHFALAQRVSAQVRDRFVWLGSLAHNMGRLRLDDLDWVARPYRSWPAYGDSKLACIMLAYEQQRRFTLAGTGQRALAAHPGLADTNLFQAHDRASGVTSRIVRASRLMQPAEQGAACELFAATVPDLCGGSYIGPDNRFQTRGNPRIVTSSRASYDRTQWLRLWEACEQAVS